MPATATKTSLYLERFTGQRRRSSGEPAWLRRLRDRALERFLALGVPTARDEEYKYTDLSALAGGELLLASEQAAANPPPFADPARGALPFGQRPRVAGARQPGLRVRSLREALGSDPDRLEGQLGAIAPDPDRHALCALNTAFFEDAVIVEAAPGAAPEAPVRISFGAGRAARHPRVLILAGRSSSVRVVETHLGEGRYWRNAVTEIRTGANARVEHCRVQLESDRAFHTGIVQGLQDRDSYLASYSLSFGARLARNDIGTRLDGPGCECALDGLYFASGRQQVDHHTAIDHAQPHCSSHQLYKGVLGGRAKGVFNGKIFVRRDAQKTDAVQNNKNLLLSPRAEVNTKPQLEIDANDVRCTHGATVGQLDKDAAFYLRSRGIGAARARSLLTYAFAADALQRIGDETVRDYAAGLLLSRLDAGPG